MKAKYLCSLFLALFVLAPIMQSARCAAVDSTLMAASDTQFKEDAPPFPPPPPPHP